MIAKDVSPLPDPPMDDLPAPVIPGRSSQRCPATTRFRSPHTGTTYGVQCKYTAGHDGDHAGHAGFADGDVFWSKRQEEG